MLGSKVHLAADTMRDLLAQHVSPASEDDRPAVARLAEAVQEATDNRSTLAYPDQGCTGEKSLSVAREKDIYLQFGRLPEPK